MKSIRKWIRDAFGFSGNEINGFLILLPLMLLLVFSQPLYHTWMANGEREERNESFDSLVTVWDDLARSPERTFVAQPVTLFHFDPNTVSIKDLISLGFSERLATRIAAYRQKGRVFRIKSDLLRIYGLDSALYEQLYGYISLPATSVPKKRTFPDRRSVQKNAPVAGWKDRKAEPKFNINTADTLLLKSVYGIGPRLAARIIKFRDRLGGFVKPDQLFEVYGLDSTTVERLLEVCFISQDFTPERININTATQERLSIHPYISDHLARLVVSYRFQHGDFPDVNDIKNLSTIGEEEVDRLLPYLTIGD